MKIPYASPRSRALAACLLCMAATSLLTACATRVQDDANDSASSGPSLSELFRIGDESMGDTILFGDIGELVAVDRSGRIFVGEAQDPKIYVFSAGGELLQTVGQRGRGPGEFERLESILAGPGDTLYVFDSGLERLTAFNPDDLELAYDFGVSGDSLGWPYWLVGVLDTGFLITYAWSVSPGDDLEGRRMHVLRVGWTGQVQPPSVFNLPATEWLMSGEGEDRFATSMPFGRDPVFRTGPGSTLYAGWTESVDIAVSAPDGTPGLAISYPLPPIPLTRSEIEQSVEDAFDWYRDAILGADLPATKPAYETFIVDDRARVWVKTTPPARADSAARWLVLDEESQLLGQVELPVDTDLRVIQGKRVYATAYGEQPTVIVYELRE